MRWTWQQDDAAGRHLDVGLSVDEHDLPQIALEVPSELRPADDGQRSIARPRARRVVHAYFADRDPQQTTGAVIAHILPTGLRYRRWQRGMWIIPL